MPAFRTPAGAVTLLASAARTVSATGADVFSNALGTAEALLIVLDVTAASGTPTLDLEIQAKFGANYGRLVTFSQLTGIATKLRKVCRYISLVAAEPTLAADPGLSSPGTDETDWLATLRAKYVIGGGTPSLTFSVVAIPIF